jgi:hypothetical protein
MLRSSTWVLRTLVLATLAAGRSAEAQPSGPFDMPERSDPGRLSVTADNGKVLPLEARFVPSGMQYAAVRVTIVNPGGTVADRVFLRASTFRLITAQGHSYNPADDVVPLRGGAAVANRCGLIYLVGNRATSCDLIFLVPSGVNSGTLEFAPSHIDAVTLPVAFRE